MLQKLSYPHEELLAEHAYATRIRWKNTVFHSGLDAQGHYLPPRTVEYIQEDENIHVAYLQCALSEARCRTLRGQNREELSGHEVIDAICQRVVRAQLGSRRERMHAYRMNHIRTELAERSDGAALLSQFATLGPIPEMPQAAAA